MVDIPKRQFKEDIGPILFFGVFGVGLLGFLGSIFDSSVGSVPRVWGAGGTQTVSSTVVVANAAPTVSSVVVNAGSDIVLTASTTVNVNVTAVVDDTNGCNDITQGTTTVMLYRSGITSSTCITTANNNNCYRATAFTASSTCSATSINTTTTFAVYYLADATDSSNTQFSAQNWLATVIFKDPQNATGSADSSGVEVLSLSALDVTTSSINYGSMNASSTTGSTNQVATTTNAGNTSTTLWLKANQTLVSGSNSIATSNQRYATTTFTCCGATGTGLSETLTKVTGFILTKPTAIATPVQGASFWGLEINAGQATGTYTGQTLFQAVFATST